MLKLAIDVLGFLLDLCAFLSKSYLSNLALNNFKFIVHFESH